MKQTVKWKLIPNKKGGGWHGVIVLSTGQLQTAVKAKGKTQGEAISKAAGLAEQIIGNPLLSAALPPGTGAALKATKLIAQAAGAGDVGKALSKLTGEGAKRIGSALKSLKFW